MQHDRPIQNTRLQDTLTVILALARMQDLGCAVILVSEDESACGYQLYTTYNAIIEDASVQPFGRRFRLTATEQAERRLTADQLARGTGHLLRSLTDFGRETQGWMQDLLTILTRRGDAR